MEGCGDGGEFVRKVYTSDDILQSESDQRKYCCVELTNGLTVFLISDPDTDRSAAALDVHIGKHHAPVQGPSPRSDLSASRWIHSKPKEWGGSYDQLSIMMDK